MTTVFLCGCLVTIWIRESFTSSFDSVSAGRNRTGHLICAQASSKCKSQTVSMLSEAGAPLQAPLALTTEEAVALILSYEALLSFTDKPFAKETLSVIAKLLASIPTES